MKVEERKLINLMGISIIIRMTNRMKMRRVRRKERLLKYQKEKYGSIRSIEMKSEQKYQRKVKVLGSIVSIEQKSKTYRVEDVGNVEVKGNIG